MNPKSVLTFAVLAMFLVSCKKSGSDIVLSSGLTIINTAVGVEAAKLGMDGTTDYSTQPAISYGGTGYQAFLRGPQSIQIIDTANPTVNLFNDDILFDASIYTMFLVGDSSNVETIIKEESSTLPYVSNYMAVPSEDSVVHIRFANLSPGSMPLKIKLADSTGNEADALAYKSFTDWKGYTATAATTNFAFQIRDADVDTLITTYTFTANSTNRFKDITIIMKGWPKNVPTNAANAFGIITNNYY